MAGQLKDEKDAGETEMNRLNLLELAEFLVKAKIKTYAADGKEISSQRPGFKELEFKENVWEYRDSYSGFYFAPGQEVVRYKGKPVWTMAYSGGMSEEFNGDLDFAKKTFAFLKNALLSVAADKPFRGPEDFKAGDFRYVCAVEGGIKLFKGTERIFYKGKEVFRQDYIGGLIVSK